MNKYTALFLTIICSVLLILAIFLAGNENNNKNNDDVYNENKHPTFVPYDLDYQIMIETENSGEFICE